MASRHRAAVGRGHTGASAGQIAHGGRIMAETGERGAVLERIGASLEAMRAEGRAAFVVDTSWPCSPVVGVSRTAHGGAYMALGHGCGWFARTWQAGVLGLVSQGLRVGLRADLLRAVLDCEQATGASLTGQGWVWAEVAALEWRGCGPAWPMSGTVPENCGTYSGRPVLASLLDLREHLAHPDRGQGHVWV